MQPHTHTHTQPTTPKEPYKRLAKEDLGQSFCRLSPIHAFSIKPQLRIQIPDPNSLLMAWSTPLHSPYAWPCVLRKTHTCDTEEAVEICHVHTSWVPLWEKKRIFHKPGQWQKRAYPAILSILSMQAAWGRLEGTGEQRKGQGHMCAGSCGQEGQGNTDRGPQELDHS